MIDIYITIDHFSKHTFLDWFPTFQAAIGFILCQ